MSQNQDLKKTVVAEITDKLANSHSVVFIDYRGINVAEVTELRNLCRAQGVDYLVLKNTLIRRAANDIGITGLDSILEGPTAVAFGKKDPVAPAKVLVEYAKKNKKISIKAGLVGKSVLDVVGVEALAALPPKEVLIAKMMGSLNAPVTNFVGVLSALLRSVVYVIDARKKQLGGE